MTKGIRSRKAIALASISVGLTAATGIALAAQTVVTDTNDVRLRVVKSSFDDGFESTWHTHPGPAIVQVEEGLFKLYQGSCAPKIIGRGETYVEIPGVPVKAVAKGRIVWTTTLILPVGAPPATDTADPCA